MKRLCSVKGFASTNHVRSQLCGQRSCSSGGLARACSCLCPRGFAASWSRARKVVSGHRRCKSRTRCSTKLLSTRSNTNGAAANWSSPVSEFKAANAWRRSLWRSLARASCCRRRFRATAFAFALVRAFALGGIVRHQRQRGPQVCLSRHGYGTDDDEDDGDDHHHVEGENSAKCCC